jgi:hypothetical protein
VTGKTIDLDAYLIRLCRQYARFSYAGIERFRFPERHAIRAVLRGRIRSGFATSITESSIGPDRRPYTPCPMSSVAMHRER